MMAMGLQWICAHVNLDAGQCGQRGHAGVFESAGRGPETELGSCAEAAASANGKTTAVVAQSDSESSM